ncbi:MAG: division plane positioning ATPase MipZ [Pseudomonadota bacterium]
MKEGSVRRSAHVIVIGNEKGGSGKSTTAIHLIVHLLKIGQRVASIDLDCRQRSLTRYIDNRRRWSAQRGLNLELPKHFAIRRGDDDSAVMNEEREFTDFAQAVGSVERDYDFVVIDTPASDTYLMRLAHSMADTLVTPVNDSFIDLDVLGHVDGDTGAVVDISHFARMVRDARAKRRTVDEVMIDWVVVRNRIASLETKNNKRVSDALAELSVRLGYRVADGICERVVFREFFPRGLTALDPMEEEALGTRPSLSHLAARREIRALIEALRLPIDERGRQRAEARRVWMERSRDPLELTEIIA